MARTSLDVQWALQAPKVTIARSGFSQRPQRYGRGSDVNYGLEVHNERARFDATNVTLLVNMVDATNRVLGTGFVRIRRLPASSVFYVGGQTTIPTQKPVSRIEVVVSASSDQKVAATPLLISDLIIAPSLFEPPYVGSVRGQLLNQSRVPMDSGVVGVVIQDANGNIIGGGSRLRERAAFARRTRGVQRQRAVQRNSDRKCRSGHRFYHSELPPHSLSGLSPRF